MERPRQRDGKQCVKTLLLISIGVLDVVLRIETLLLQLPPHAVGFLVKDYRVPRFR